MQLLPIADKPVDVIALHRGKYVEPDKQPIPLHVKAALAKLNRIRVNRDHFKELVDIDMDNTGQQAITLYNLKPSSRPDGHESGGELEEEDEANSLNRLNRHAFNPSMSKSAWLTLFINRSVGGRKAHGGVGIRRAPHFKVAHSLYT